MYQSLRVAKVLLSNLYIYCEIRSFQRLIAKSKRASNYLLHVIHVSRRTYVLTVFPQIRSAGIIFFQGLQMRVLLERGY